LSPNKNRHNKGDIMIEVTYYSTYAVSDDCVGKITVKGTTLKELFGKEGVR